VNQGLGWFGFDRESHRNKRPHTKKAWNLQVYNKKEDMEEEMKNTSGQVANANEAPRESLQRS